MVKEDKEEMEQFVDLWSRRGVIDEKGEEEEIEERREEKKKTDNKQNT